MLTLIFFLEISDHIGKMRLFNFTFSCQVIQNAKDLSPSLKTDFVMNNTFALMIDNEDSRRSWSHRRPGPRRRFAARRPWRPWPPNRRRPCPR